MYTKINCCQYIIFMYIIYKYSQWKNISTNLLDEGYVT